MNKNSNTMKAILFILLCLGVLGGCKDDTSASEGIYDPNAPLEITKFKPSCGPARTRLYIFGKNFGTELEQISVKIGDIPAKVIGCNGSIIYTMVPFKATKGTIEVSVGENTVMADSTFRYLPQNMVTTLAGYVDETGKVKIQDGPFKTAGFGGPGWMTIDPKNKSHIYMIDGGTSGGNSIKLLDLKTQTVSTLINRGQGNWENLRGVAFTNSGDTMLVVNHQNSDNAIAVSYMTRANAFKKPQPLIYGKRCGGAMVHPNGEIYYNSRVTGYLIRYDPKTRESTPLYPVGGADPLFFMFMHPNGKYAYFTVPPWAAIVKAEYDWENNTFKPANIFCGKQGSRGWVDGQGVNARLGNPYQGCFVKNERYVAEGRDDVYDFYFCDQYSHAIRYVTPEGFVFTYAGRGSQGMNNSPYGYVDGDLLKEARFRDPTGVYYDDENKIFYIGDTNNKRVRMIRLDE